MDSEVKDIDICLILEGTYPFVHGGVASWVHEMIRNQPDFTFFLICIVPPDFVGEPCFELPKNVVGMQVSHLSKIRRRRTRINLFGRRTRHFFREIRTPLLRLVMRRATLTDYEQIVSVFKRYRDYLNDRDLMCSKDSWSLMLEIYREVLPEISFLDFFWSWRCLVGGLFAAMMDDLPPARCYHAVCTGYAGLLMARAKLEYQAPCLLTEHGIYTVERRFEIAFAEWLVDQKSFSMSVNKSHSNYELRDLWIDFFVEYGKFCYGTSDLIISLFQDNMKIQIAAGAPAEKCRSIPNGIDLARYGGIVRAPRHHHTLAFIGRIVPIKDVKTYIRAVAILAQDIPDMVAYIIGGHDEDGDYYQECLDLIEAEKLSNIIKLTGKVDIIKYLPEVDVVVLSSISEAQPLVILEAGAAGIPTVATNVGACREMLEGGPGDDFGPGGIVVPLASPTIMAQALGRLLLDDQFYASCSQAIRKRVERYYSSIDQFRSYHELYDSMVSKKHNG